MGVFLSMLLGVSVSFFQMQVRRGISNKLLALLINQVTMEANRSFVSVGSVLMSIAGAVCFQQTVKGRGVSQAASSQSDKDPAPNLKAYLAMIAGLFWAGYLNMADQARTA